MVEMPFSIWAWALGNFVYIISIVGSVSGAVFWLAHANYIAFERLLEILTPLGLAALVIAAVFNFVLLPLQLLSTGSEISSILEEVEIDYTLATVGSVDLENLLRGVLDAISVLEWATFILVVFIYFGIILLLAKHIFKP